MGGMAVRPWNGWRILKGPKRLPPLTPSTADKTRPYNTQCGCALSDLKKTTGSSSLHCAWLTCVCCRAQNPRHTMSLQDFNTANMPSTANTASVATPNHAAPETRSSVGDHDLKKGFNAREKFHKPLKFHLAVLSILLMVFIVSIDATALAAVIPVSAQPLLSTAQPQQ